MGSLGENPPLIIRKGGEEGGGYFKTEKKGLTYLTRVADREKPWEKDRHGSERREGGGAHLLAPIGAK